MGHYSTALTLKKELENKNIDVEVIDFYEYIFPKARNIIYGAFNFLVSKFSSIYNFFYQISSNTNVTPLKRIIDKKLEVLFESKELEIVVSTFPVCSNYVSLYKKSRNKNIKLYTYITDIDVNKEWITEETDMYFVGSKITKKQLENYDVNSEKIKVVGIPVKQEFKKNLYSKCKNEILIMGGGLGLLPNIDKIIKELISNKNIHVTLIAGKNKKLFYKYNEKYNNLSVVGYTNEVYKYMEKAEIIITKAGGITLFEAINSQTPIYVISPFLYQEIGNAMYIEKEGIGIINWNDNESVATDIINLLNYPMKLERMKRNMRKITNNLENTNILNTYLEEKIC